jgi:hypothetical protein
MSVCSPSARLPVCGPITGSAGTTLIAVRNILIMRTRSSSASTAGGLTLRRPAHQTGKNTGYRNSSLMDLIFEIKNLYFR